MRGLADLSIFDDAGDAVLAFDDRGRYTYANSAACRLYGTPDIVGSHIQDYAAAPANGEYEEAWHELRGSGTVFGETVMQSADGRLKRVRYRVGATDLAGVHLAVVSAAGPPANGVREGRLLELFQSVFEHAPEALLVADDRRRYTHGNRMARSFLGVSKETLVGNSVDDLAAPSAAPQLPQLWKRFLSGGTMNGILPIVLPNGLTRSVVFRARANVRPGRHLISFQIAGLERQPAALEVRDLGPAEPLTFREREILTLLARGSSAKAIADGATLSAETVRTHVRNAMKKLGANTRSHAIALAIGLRQIDP
jgi:PAS domain S-box-containing protein